MKVAVIAETDADEPRVAATPETVKKMVALGATVAVQAGAGVKSDILDEDYTAAGATIGAVPLNDADIVLQVRRPSSSSAARGRTRRRRQSLRDSPLDWLGLTIHP